MAGFWDVLLRQVCALLRPAHRLENWHCMLNDPSSATLLRQEDKNVAQLQRTLQEFSLTGVETFGSVIVFLTTKICVVQDDEILFTYIRAVLEVFILYSITTSDFAWLNDSRAVSIGRQTEVMSEITFSRSCIPHAADSLCKEDCLLLAALLEKMSRREHCRAEIIKKIIEVAGEMNLDAPFMTYEHGCASHELNAMAFSKRILPTGYYWIAMAYCLAIEPIDYKAPPTYSDEEC